MATTTLPQNDVDRKDRVPSPSGGSASSRSNVVDHHAPHGECYMSLSRSFLRSVPTTVTEELPGRRGGTEGKQHMIVVQPLKRSEMQVCPCRRTPLDFVFTLQMAAFVCAGSWNYRGVSDSHSSG
jgi:hypothetical protein